MKKSGIVEEIQTQVIGLDFDFIFDLEYMYLVEVVGELLQFHISKFGFELELVSLLLVHILVQF